MPLFWWRRIIVHHKKVKGWKLLPSHNNGTDLTEVWLKQEARERLRGPIQRPRLHETAHRSIFIA